MNLEVWSWIAGIVGGVVAIGGVIRGVLKFVVPLFTKRAKVYAVLALTGDPYHGNMLTITNGTDQPVLVDHWELRWMKWTWKGRKAGQVEGDDDFDSEGFLLAPKARRTFNFAEADHFGWGVRMAKHGRLYLRLYLDGGKKPLEIMVHNPTAR